jgi:hypothetical protein
MWKRLDQAQRINPSRMMARIARRFKAAFVMSFSLRFFGVGNGVDRVCVYCNMATFPDFRLTAAQIMVTD